MYQKLTGKQHLYEWERRARSKLPEINRVERAVRAPLHRPFP